MVHTCLCNSGHRESNTLLCFLQALLLSLSPPSPLRIRKLKSNEKGGSGKIAQQLRALGTLPEDPGAILSTHMVTHNCLHFCMKIHIHKNESKEYFKNKKDSGSEQLKTFSKFLKPTSCTRSPFPQGYISSKDCSEQRVLSNL